MFSRMHGARLACSGKITNMDLQKVTKTVLYSMFLPDALDSVEDETDVIRSVWTYKGIQNGSSLHIENIAIILANNQHPLRCIDFRRTDRVDVKTFLLLAMAI